MPDEFKTKSFCHKLCFFLSIKYIHEQVRQKICPSSIEVVEVLKNNGVLILSKSSFENQTSFLYIFSENIRTVSRELFKEYYKNNYTRNKFRYCYLKNKDSLKAVIVSKTHPIHQISLSI